MEMVAASKMRKAQDRMRAAKPYSEKIHVIGAPRYDQLPSECYPQHDEFPLRAKGHE